MTLHVEGLGWHGPIPVVGAPNRSYDYGVVAPPRAWDRGIPGTPCDSTGGGPPPFPITLLVSVSTLVPASALPSGVVGPATDTLCGLLTIPGPSHHSANPGDADSARGPRHRSRLSTLTGPATDAHRVFALNPHTIRCDCGARGVSAGAPNSAQPPRSEPTLAHREPDAGKPAYRRDRARSD